MQTICVHELLQNTIPCCLPLYALGLAEENQQVCYSSPAALETFTTSSLISSSCLGAGIVLVLLLAGATLACCLCHLIVTRHLEGPAAKLAKNGRYKGMQEFEMPEIKSKSWGMP